MIIGISTLAVFGGGTAAFVLRPAAPTSPEAPPVPPASGVSIVRSWIDGSPLEPGAPQAEAVAVILDNAPEARPQSGIADAPFVLEVPVEGGRTRFLAFFPTTSDVREVGPVRSARPYLIELAAAFNATLVHVGGSPAALALLGGQAKRQRIPEATGLVGPERGDARAAEGGGPWGNREVPPMHVDQYYDPPFRRVDFRRAPFNVYTAVGALADFLAGTRRMDAPPAGAAGDGGGWVVADALSEDAAVVSAPRVRIAYGEHVAEWTYDAAERAYARAQDGRAHRDADGKEVTAENVVVLEVGTRVLDAIGRLAVTFPVSGDGSACAVYRDGIRVSASCALAEPADAGIRGFRITGAPLRPGTTWIELVPRGTVVE